MMRGRLLTCLAASLVVARLPGHAWTGFLDEYTHINGTEGTREEGLPESLSALLVSESWTTRRYRWRGSGATGKWPPPTAAQRAREPISLSPARAATIRSSEPFARRRRPIPAHHPRKNYPRAPYLHHGLRRRTRPRRRRCPHG